MPEAIKTVGTGMTECMLLQFDTSDPADLDALVNAAAHSMRKTSFRSLAENLKEISIGILKEEGLPYDPKVGYRLADASVPTGSASSMRAAKGAGEPVYSLQELPLQLGYEPDSPVMFAAAILAMIERTFAFAREGDIDQTLAAAFAVGELVTLVGVKEVWEADAIRGDKVLRAAKQGHAMEHGDAAEVARRRQAQAASFEHHLKQGLGKMDAYEAAAKEHGVGARTIQRAVKLLQS